MAVFAQFYRYFSVIESIVQCMAAACRNPLVYLSCCYSLFFFSSSVSFIIIAIDGIRTISNTKIVAQDDDSNHDDEMKKWL